MDNRIGFGKRFGAALLDAVIVIAAGSLIGGMLGGLFGGAAGVSVNTDDAAAAAMAGGILGTIAGAMLGITVVGVAYGLIEGLIGASPGKMILGIQIGTAAGTVAPLATLLTRYAVKNVSLLFGLVALITGVEILAKVGNIAGFIVFIGLFFIFGAAKQALHDKVAKTAVYPKSALA